MERSFSNYYMEDSVDEPGCQMCGFGAESIRYCYYSVVDNSTSCEVAKIVWEGDHWEIDSDSIYGLNLDLWTMKTLLNCLGGVKRPSDEMVEEMKRLSDES